MMKHFKMRGDMGFGLEALKAMVLLLLFAALIIGCAGKPPKEERESAEQAYLAAKLAEKCAPVQYEAARNMLERARKAQSEKKYDEAKRLFETAKDLSEKALKKARENEDCANPPEEALPEDEPTEAMPVSTSLSDDPALKDPNYELQAVFFDYDSSEISDENREIIERNAIWLKNFPDVPVQIAGHCDERGSTEYNLALGERRARSVKKHLTMYGVEPERISIISYGEESPLVDGFGEEAWAKNRRAEFTKR